MLTDLLVIPIVICSSIIVKGLLIKAGAPNSIVFLACYSIVLQLLFTALFRFHLRDAKDSYVTKGECAFYGSLMSSATAVGTYVLMSLVPALKTPFFFLKWLPSSQYWADLLIVSLPTYVTYVAARIVAMGLLK